MDPFIPLGLGTIMVKANTVMNPSTLCTHFLISTSETSGMPSNKLDQGRVPTGHLLGNFKVPYIDRLEMSALLLIMLTKQESLVPRGVSSTVPCPRGVSKSGRESVELLSLVSRLTSSFASWMELQAHSAAGVTGTANISSTRHTANN
jgi:hypothetical protein